jgi:serine/threonine protein kinase
MVAIKQVTLRGVSKEQLNLLQQAQAARCPEQPSPLRRTALLSLASERSWHSPSAYVPAAGSARRTLRAPAFPARPQEINLLKLLTNPYIVEYIESFNTKESLYIVMEFVENGSLSQIVKRFGRLNESLVGIYTLQAPLFIVVISAARR